MIRKLILILGVFWASAANGAACDAGYYLNDGECALCNPHQEAYYCPGDDMRYPCPTVSDASGYGASMDNKRRDLCWAWFDGFAISNGSMDRYWCYVDLDADTYGVSGKSKCGVYTSDLKCDGGYYSDGTGGNDRYEDFLTPAELANRACQPVDAGYYSPDGATERTVCPAGHYCPTGMADPIRCPTGTYSDATGNRDTSACTPCPRVSGATFYGSQESDNRNSCWAWFDGGAISNGSMDRYWCYVDLDADTYGESGESKCGVYIRDLKCDGGYYSDETRMGMYEAKLTPTELANKVCQQVGVGYYSPANATERTLCPVGTTTIGYGPGADEAADCGHVLHIGDTTLYLRSEKRTTPALHVKIDGSTFYGDMSTARKGHLRIKIGDMVYSVYDDSM